MEFSAPDRSLGVLVGGNYRVWGAKTVNAQIQHGVSQGARALGFRGRCLVGLLDLQLILLRYCLDAWTCFPPPGQDLWVTRALIIARLWNFIEPEAEFPEYLQDRKRSCGSAFDGSSRSVSSGQPFVFRLGRPFSSSREHACRLRSALRKILEVIHLISLQNPDYPSHVEIWNASSSVHLLPPDPPVSDRCRGGFQILDRLIRQYSFRGQATSDGRIWRRDCSISCAFLVAGAFCLERKDDASSDPDRMIVAVRIIEVRLRTAMNLSSTEFVRLAPSQLMDAALASFLPTRVSPSSVESWHPDDSLYGSLVANIRPSVFYIQLRGSSLVSRLLFMRTGRALGTPLSRHQIAGLSRRRSICQGPSRSATMFLTLSLFMKEYGFEGDEDKSSPADRFVRAADIFRRASSLAARGAGAKIEYDHFRINGELAPGRRFPQSSPNIDGSAIPLLKDVCRPAIGSDRSRSQYEVFFVDFDTQAELVQYLCRPEVVNYCHNVLGPLRDVVSLIHDRFRVRLPLPKDAPWLRRHLANFLHHLHAPLVQTNLSVAEAYPDSFLYLLDVYGAPHQEVRLRRRQHRASRGAFSGKPQNRSHARDDTAMAMSARLAEVARESAISTPELLVIPDIHATLLLRPLLTAPLSRERDRTRT
ncbi:hypothetical protein B0H13DRAFT_1913263 [Mycena leptocephala]|nr:hypothetical protein B0H13DRAFT_1913263 [Mycena leptocephala]